MSATTRALLPIDIFTMWLATGERGISSETIVGYLTGVPLRQERRISHPYDPADFRRCERLLRQVPLARLAFGQMKSASPAWARLVDEWDALVALMEEEAPGAIDDPYPSGSAAAPRAYLRMKEILAAPTAVLGRPT